MKDIINEHDKTISGNIPVWNGVSDPTIYCGAAPKLYVNGLHMIEVVISFNPKSDGKDIEDFNLNTDILRNAIRLINYDKPSQSFKKIEKGELPVIESAVDDVPDLKLPSGPFFSTEHGVFYTGDEDGNFTSDKKKVSVTLYFGYGPPGNGNTDRIRLGCIFNFPGGGSQESSTSGDYHSSSAMITLKDKFSYKYGDIGVSVSTGDALANGMSNAVATCLYFNFNDIDLKCTTLINVEYDAKMSNNGNPFFNYKECKKDLSFWTMTDSNIEVDKNKYYTSQIFHLNKPDLDWNVQFSAANRKYRGVSVIYVKGNSGGYNFAYWEWATPDKYFPAQFIMYDHFGNGCLVSFLADEGLNPNKGSWSVSPI